MTIRDNLLRVRERIARAASAAGRSADDVTLVGVTKYVGADQAAELVAAGCTDLGESRPQDLWHKVGEVSALLTQRAGARAPSAMADGRPPAAPLEIHWHLIGHLQRNKVRRTLPLLSLVHSVDSERLLAAIDEVGKDPPQSVLLEVNTSGEAAKHGLAPGEVEPLLAAAARFPHVAICGLMTMAALEGGPAETARNFAVLRELRDRLRATAPHCVRLDELSMGMSGDFEAAICEGATIVRVGTVLWEE